MNAKQIEVISTAKDSIYFLINCLEELDFNKTKTKIKLKDIFDFIYNEADPTSFQNKDIKISKFYAFKLVNKLEIFKQNKDMYISNKMADDIIEILNWYFESDPYNSNSKSLFENNGIYMFNYLNDIS